MFPRHRRQGRLFRRFYGFARQHTASAFDDARNAVRHPVDTAGRATDILRSIARTVRPVTETRSSLMTARKLGWRYDVLEIQLTRAIAAGELTPESVREVVIQLVPYIGYPSSGGMLQAAEAAIGAAAKTAAKTAAKKG